MRANVRLRLRTAMQMYGCVHACRKGYAEGGFFWNASCASVCALSCAKRARASRSLALCEGSLACCRHFPKCLTQCLPRGRFGPSPEHARYPSDFRYRVFRRTNFPTCDIAGIALLAICRQHGHNIAAATRRAAIFSTFPSQASLKHPRDPQPIYTARDTHTHTRPEIDNLICITWSCILSSTHKNCDFDRPTRPRATPP